MPDITITANKQIKLLTQGKYCNSDIVIVPEGGGDLFAAIIVTYPEGSTCTCTGEGMTWTAKTTTGQWVFPVFKAGTYTLSCFDGDDYDSSESKKSDTVEITAEGQPVAVTLTYQLVLYEAGNTYDDVTGGWNKTAFYYGNISFGDSYITMIPGYYSDSSEPLAIATKNSFSSGSYKYLYIDYEQTVPTAYLGATANTSGDPNALKYSVKQTLTPTERTTTYIDTSISGDFYVAVATTYSGQGGHGKYLRIYKIWLE